MASNGGRKARQKARQQQRIAWLVEMRLNGASVYWIDRVSKAGNFQDAQANYNAYQRTIKIWGKQYGNR